MTITPGMIDFIFILIAVEFALIAGILLRVRMQQLVAPLFFFLASGALLFLCLKIALTDGAAGPLATAGGGAFVTHLAAIGFAARAIAGLRRNPQP